jgi:hypothetical protein
MLESVDNLVPAFLVHMDENIKGAAAVSSR